MSASTAGGDNTAAIGTGPHLPGGTGRRVRALETVFAVGLAATLLLPGFDHTPWMDEFNHLMGAESLLDEGDLTLAPDGTAYGRGAFYTYLVAGSISLFGRSFVAARIPAYLAAVALGLLIFLWTRRHASRGAAWAALVLYAQAPITLFLAQGARFYTFHALAVFLAAISVYRAGSQERGLRLRAGWVVAAVVLLGFGYTLQLTTLIASLPLLVWLAIRMASNSRREALLVGAAAGVALLGLVAVVVMKPGLVESLWSRFNYADEWALGAVDNFRYYYWLMLDRYPVFFGVFPLSALYVTARRPDWGGLLVIGFLLPFIVHSLAAWKTERYLFYALPFFFMLTGTALAAALGWTVREARAIGGRLVDDGRWIRKTAVVGAVAMVLVFLYLGNPAFALARKMMTVPDSEWTLENRYRGHADWPAALPELRQIADERLLVSSGGIKAVYYLGRLDVVLRATVVEGGEYDTFGKLGIPAISTAQSVGRLIECTPEGVIVIEDHHWRNDWAVPPATADTILQLTEPLELPARSRLMAFRWSNRAVDPPPTGCPALGRADS